MDKNDFIGCICNHVPDLEDYLELFAKLLKMYDEAWFDDDSDTQIGDQIYMFYLGFKSAMEGV